MGTGRPGAHTGPDALGKLEADLRRLPRHQWDNYLWDFCRRFVQRARSPDTPPEARNSRRAQDPAAPGT
jgi:hypothetical protein